MSLSSHAFSARDADASCCLFFLKHCCVMVLREAERIAGNNACLALVSNPRVEGGRVACAVWAVPCHCLNFVCSWLGCHELGSLK